MTTLKPVNLSINLGATDEAQNRRAAYEKAAHKAGDVSLSGWAKKTLDKASGFEPKPTKGE